MLDRGSAERLCICQRRFSPEYPLVFQWVLAQSDVKLGGANEGKA
jgi:hypothetical protein